MLGNAYEVLLALIFPLLADPNGLLRVRPQVHQLAELLQPHLLLLQYIILQLLHQSRLQICLKTSKHSVLAVGCGSLVVKSLDDVAAQAVHNRESFGEEDEEYAAGEEHREHDLILQMDALKGLLEGAGHEEGDHEFKGDHAEAADQDDELQLIDALDQLVDARVHHDAGHLEVEVEEGGEEGGEYEHVEAQPYAVEDAVVEEAEAVEGEGDEQGGGGQHLRSLQPQPNIS